MNIRINIKPLLKKIRAGLLIPAAALVMLIGQVAIPSMAMAACNLNPNSSTGQIVSGTGQAVGGGAPDCSGSGVTTIAHAVVTILGDLIGFISIIMILVAGFKYITSGGDSNKVSSAKSTLLYAMVGIAIAAIAQVLVHFVLSTATAAGSCPSDHSILASDPKCKPKP